MAQGDDISNDVITLGKCFFHVCLHSRSFPLRTDWRKSDSSVDGEPQGNWKWHSNSSVVESSLSFSRPTATAPRRACSQAGQENANGIWDTGHKSLACEIVVKKNRVAGSGPHPFRPCLPSKFLWGIFGFIKYDGFHFLSHGNVGNWMCKKYQ